MGELKGDVPEILECQYILLKYIKFFNIYQIAVIILFFMLLYIINKWKIFTFTSDT